MKINKQMKTTMSLAAAMGTLALSANAAVVVTTDTQTVTTDLTGGFQGSPGNQGDTEANPIGAASGSDLMNGLVATASSGNFAAFGSGGLTKLTDGSADGVHGSGADNGNWGTYFSPYAIGDDGGAGQSATYDLGGSFNVASIVIYGGWIDGGRDQQNVDVLVSYDGSIFTSLGATLGGNSSSADLIFHRNTIDSADAGEFDGVQAIRFDFGNAENNGTGYSEIDVFGTAVPEPTTTALLGLSGLALILRRRK